MFMYENGPLRNLFAKRALAKNPLFLNLMKLMLSNVQLPVSLHPLIHFTTSGRHTMRRKRQCPPKRLSHRIDMGALGTEGKKCGTHTWDFRAASTASAGIEGGGEEGGESVSLRAGKQSTRNKRRGAK